MQTLGNNILLSPAEAMLLAQAAAGNIDARNVGVGNVINSLRLLAGQTAAKAAEEARLLSKVSHNAKPTTN